VAAMPDWFDAGYPRKLTEFVGYGIQVGIYPIYINQQVIKTVDYYFTVHERTIMPSVNYKRALTI
jgi:hypothetical protein